METRAHTSSGRVVPKSLEPEWFEPKPLRTNACIHVYVCTFMCTCTHPHTYVNVYTQTQIRAYTHVHAFISEGVARLCLATVPHVFVATMSCSTMKSRNRRVLSRTCGVSSSLPAPSPCSRRPPAPPYSSPSPPSSADASSLPARSWAPACRGQGSVPGPTYRACGTGSCSTRVLKSPPTKRAVVPLCSRARHPGTS